MRGSKVTISGLLRGVFVMPRVPPSAKATGRCMESAVTGATWRRGDRERSADHGGGYAIRFRCEGSGGRVALVVEDPCGAAYVFSDGALQVRLTGRNAAVRLASLLERSIPCAAVSVPSVAPYTLDELRRLIPARAGTGCIARAT